MGMCAVTLSIYFIFAWILRTHLLSYVSTLLNRQGVLFSGNAALIAS